MIAIPDKRLLSVAELVRQGAYFSDIGTDHAYLPIFLLQSGKIIRAVCSDINEGPLASAMENVREAGLIDKAEFVLSDGAERLSDYPITDFAICGMGGELIADIIEKSFDMFAKPGVRVIMQPMTRVSHLRKRLAALGFLTVAESYSKASGRYYLAIAAEYTGESCDISDFEAEFGKEPCRVNFSEEKQGYIKAKIASLEKAVRGKRLGGELPESEAEILKKAKEIFGYL